MALLQSYVVKQQFYEQILANLNYILTVVILVTVQMVFNILLSQAVVKMISYLMHLQPKNNKLLITLSTINISIYISNNFQGVFLAHKNPK